MSPARRAAPKRRRRALGVTLALLGVLAAAICGLAIYLGILPGVRSLYGPRSSNALPDDSTLAKSVAPASPGESALPSVDTAAVPAVAAPDSMALVTSADSAAG